MFTTRKGLLLIILLFILSSGGWHLSDIVSTPHPDEVHLSDARKVHILYGDKTGGGHLHGVGKACKSEFPKSWSEEKIVDTVKLIAANDNLDWKEEKNGYHIAQSNEDGVLVRVVLDREKDDVVTAYPLNAQRNPCPRKPANDNYND